MHNIKFDQKTNEKHSKKFFFNKTIEQIPENRRNVQTYGCQYLMESRRNLSIYNKIEKKKNSH